MMMLYSSSRFALAIAFFLTLACLNVSSARSQNLFNVQTSQAWSGYAIPNGVWLSGDYTGDGRADLLHVVNGTDYVHPWISVDDGKFQVKTFRPWRGYGMPNGIWMNADLNGDERVDVVHIVNNTDYVHPWISNGNGTFKVGTFRPWRGYAMPNGIWVVADLNGDQRDDLLHVVQYTDYVHTWISNGNGTFKVGTFRPWRGYAMPNGVWRVGDFNGDGRDDLVHAVKGADYVHTWISNGDGTFAVGTFRPWNGYAIPNGLWRVGDFNGDKRDDILHVVKGTDYVHIWLSRGNGTFTVGTFRPWNGYAMPNGIWRVTDLDGDGKDDVVHAVNGTDYAHVWRPTTAHKFEVSTFSPWGRYAIPNGLWFVGDYDGDSKGDILHVVANSNYVHPWLSRMPAPGEMQLAGLEFIQTVQNMLHSVPMIADKTTVVRAYLNLNATVPRIVRGRLFVRNGGTGRSKIIDSLRVTSVDSARNGNLRIKRETTDFSLNFRVPGDLLARGQLFARLVQLQDAASNVIVPCSNCDSNSSAIHLQNAAPLRVRVFGMSYVMNSTVRQPRARDFDLIRSWLRRAYPTVQVLMSERIVSANPTPKFTCGAINAQLAAVRAIEVANNAVDARTHYYGLVDDGGFFMRGCSAGIPGTPQPQTVSSGPSGSDSQGWDTDGSYADWYAGHELGHTYGRSHIGSGCGDSNSDLNYPYPEGQISPLDGAFVGFDVGDATNGIAMRALPGTKWHDVMSYCPNQWMSAYTYSAILARLTAENALAASAVADLGGRDTTTEKIETASANPAPIIEGNDRLNLMTAGRGGISTLAAPASSPPLEIVAEMAAPYIDVAPAYRSAPPVIFADATGAGEYRRGPVPAKMREGAGQPPGVGPAAPTLPAVSGVKPVRGKLLSIVGTVNLTRTTGDISFVNPIPRGLARQGSADDTAVIRLLDGQDKELASHKVFVLLDTGTERGEDVTGVIDALVLIEAKLRHIVLMLEHREVDRFTFPTKEPREFKLGVTPKFVEATVDKIKGTLNVRLRDGGERTDGATYLIEVSTDEGSSWQVQAIGKTRPETVVDLGTLKAGNKIGVRIRLNTGLRSEVIAKSIIDLQ